MEDLRMENNKLTVLEKMIKNREVTPAYTVKLKGLEEEYMEGESLINKEEVQYIVLDEKDFTIQTQGDFFKIRKVIE